MVHHFTLEIFFKQFSLRINIFLRLIANFVIILFFEQERQNIHLKFFLKDCDWMQKKRLKRLDAKDLYSLC